MTTNKWKNDATTLSRVGKKNKIKKDLAQCLYTFERSKTYTRRVLIKYWLGCWSRANSSVSHIVDHQSHFFQIVTMVTAILNQRNLIKTYVYRGNNEHIGNRIKSLKRWSLGLYGRSSRNPSIVTPLIQFILNTFPIVPLIVHKPRGGSLFVSWLSIYLSIIIII